MWCAHRELELRDVPKMIAIGRAEKPATFIEGYAVELHQQHEFEVVVFLFAEQKDIVEDENLQPLLRAETRTTQKLVRTLATAPFCMTSTSPEL
jgi:hypothetical protein